MRRPKAHPHLLCDGRAILLSSGSRLSSEREESIGVRRSKGFAAGEPLRDKKNKDHLCL